MTQENGMATDHPKTVRPDGPGNENKNSEAQAADDICRCKETSLMKPRQLLRLMLNDLSFWKKAKEK